MCSFKDVQLRIKTDEVNLSPLDKIAIEQSVQKALEPFGIVQTTMHTSKNRIYINYRKVTVDG